MERFLIRTGRIIVGIGIALAWLPCMVIEVGDLVEQRGQLRRSLRRQEENRRANPDFVKATEIE